MAFGFHGFRCQKLSELVNFYMHLVSSAALSLSVFSAYHFAADEMKIRNGIEVGESTIIQDYLKRHVSFSKQFLDDLWCIVAGY